LAVAAAQHVARLEVAVADAGGVGRREAASGGEERVEDRGGRPTCGAQPVGEGLAVDQLHGDEVAPRGGADLVHGDHAGVGEPGHRAGLAQQPLARLIAGGRPAQHLERDPSLQVGIERGVDGADRAGAELALDPVAPEHGAGCVGRGDGGRARRRARRRFAICLAICLVLTLHDRSLARLLPRPQRPR
jgi:hypothetical protein